MVVQKPPHQGVQGFDLDVEEGDSWGVVGESGCGKSTLAKMVMGLEKPTQGKIHFQSHELFNHLSENRTSSVSYTHLTLPTICSV